MLIRPANKFTVGYTPVPCDDPAFGNRGEVVRTDEGQVHFRKNARIFAVAEFVRKLLNLITETELVL
jgi:hypothetical protein